MNVTVRAGCDARSIRTYVLLADVPAEAVALPSAGPTTSASAAGNPGIAASQRTTSTARGNASAGGAADSGNTAGRTSSRPRTAGVADRADGAPVRPRSVAQAPAPARAVPAARLPQPAAPATRASAPPRAAAAPAGPRLQVDALEPVPTGDAGLQTSPSLSLPGANDLARRAEAAAQWRALSAPPEEAQRDAQRIQSLEATLKALREQTAENQRTLLAMRSELAEARDSRYNNPLVYALGLLLLLALIAIVMLWRLSRRAVAPAWWGEGPEPRRGDRAPLQADSQFDDAGEHPITQPDGLRPAGELDPRHAALLASTNADTPYGGMPEPAPIRGDASATRPVNTEELFDVQQQSDFFLSLGQHDQAIAVLVEHIAENPDTSALAYLDLFKIYHALGRRDDYARLSDSFERAFNAEVPAFDDFSLGGRGLEHYRGALARIESQWPAAGTLALIEELIFRKPGVHEDEAFDLAAYQELLLLYAVAKEVIDPDSAPPAPVTPLSFADTFTHQEQTTAPATLIDEITPTQQTSPAELEQAAPVLPPSIYGGIDEGLHSDTVMFSNTPAPAPAEERTAPPKTQVDVDLAEFDRTAFETLAAPIEPAAPPLPASDPHVIDFDLFDPATEAEIAPRIIKR
ncbi:MAG: hypothetical protein EOP80_01655 [Variovorax sp.]|nr:MAG: hypothetical protein EOP80_01655 [Variovorax sp.]